MLKAFGIALPGLSARSAVGICATAFPLKRRAIRIVVDCPGRAAKALPSGEKTTGNAFAIRALQVGSIYSL